MNEVMDLVCLFVHIFNSLKALASKHMSKLVDDVYVM